MTEECRHWGKYRGTVLLNLDPEGLGRLLCEVPLLPGMLLNWALPCIPYAGLEEGFFAMPPIGANVWVEFENGNPSYPIWSGCFWETGEIPVALELSPEDPALVKVFRSAFCTLVLNDTPGTGGITLSVIDPAVEVPVTLALTTAGLDATVGPVLLSMNAEAGVTITVGEAVVSLTEAAMAVTVPTIELTGETAVNVTGPTGIEGAVDVTGAVEIAGDTSVTGAFEVEGETNLTGAVEVEGGVDIAGAVAVEGDVNVVGAVEVEGETNVLGAFQVEGDLNLLGAGQVEGNFAVAGLIEGIVVPPLL